MIFLNLNNVEEIVLKDKQLRLKLPDYKYLFDSYDLAMFSTSLKTLAMRCLNDFLKKCIKNDLLVIGEYLKDTVEIVKLNLEPVVLFDSDINYLELALSKDYNCIDVCLYRKENIVKGILWK